ncbi:MAG: deoxyribose-phosphate aldolase [Verrucomicrobia bacterium]|nr:deoxyribose-phosphate aldolase [Verrucomicrobiota bacterium]
MNLTPIQLAATLDSTNLRLDATSQEIEKLCHEAAEQRFACVMIYPTSIPLAARVLAGTGMRIGTVIGFPSGRFATSAKAAEIAAAHAAGAHEVDIVMDYAALREGQVATVAAEVTQLSTLAHKLGLLIKVIVETCYLRDEDLLTALRVCEDADADFIKTSTGFGSAGAKPAHLAFWAAQRRGKIQLKAAGGIKTLADARALIAAGAARLGTSSAAAIVADARGATPAAVNSGAY